MESAETVRVELPPEVTDVGLSEAVTPAGAPLTERLTVSAAPEVSAVLMLAVPDAPWFTFRAVGLALIEKSLTGIVSETDAEWVVVPSMPLTVRV